MKWERTGLNVESSDTMPPYRVTRFRIDGKALFRPGFKGEFLGFQVWTSREAKEVCERHHAINQEARNASDPKEPAGRDETPA